ncbi:MAG: hypothetical protein V3S64_05365 [bacterium]
MFWTLFGAVSIASTIFVYVYFAKAFPLVDLDLRMDRSQALQAARRLAKVHGWGPEDFRQTVRFSVEQEVQNFVELEGGGVSAFRAMITDGLFSPHRWVVRHFREGEVRETWIVFKPSGDFLGFEELRSEQWPGTNVAAPEARRIAEQQAKTVWKVQLDQYKLVESSQKNQPGGRIDHSLVYERPDRRIHAKGAGRDPDKDSGRYRLRLVVSGNRLTALERFIKIPEGFILRHREMRSANNTISMAATIAIALVYFLGGCVGGLFLLIRLRALIWRAPVIWGIVIGLLSFFSSLNDWPFIWMDYKTAVPLLEFLLSRIFAMLAQAVAMGALAALVFMVAEGLSRLAFPSHPMLWKAWSQEAGGSPAITGRTLAGYLLVPLDLAYIVALYWVGYTWLGWWSPADTLIDPNVVATYLPWLSPLTDSLFAGFFEESLFRAVPLAGAALLGRRFGRPFLWIGVALLLQALIFGAAHANYASQPAYSRLVELILPSIFYGAIYLRYGLIPGIIVHFAFDAVLMATPVFISSSPGMGFSQALTVLLLLLPVWILLYRRVRMAVSGGSWRVPYNLGWRLPPPSARRPAPATRAPTAGFVHPTLAKGLLAAGAAALAVWGFAANFQTNAPRLEADRELAEKIAQETMVEKGFQTGDSWKVTSVPVTGVDQMDAFVWRRGGADTYARLIGSYLDPPLWQVRYTRFEGTMEQRQERFEIGIDHKGRLNRFHHILPEARPGGTLSREQARATALKAAANTFGLDGLRLEEISARPSERPGRRDWSITYQVPGVSPGGSQLRDGQARVRIEISGNTVSDAYRYVFLPEEWVRQEEERLNLLTVVNGVSIALLTLFLISGLVLALVGWTRGQFSFRVFRRFFLLIGGLEVLNIVNGWPATIDSLSPIEPLFNQLFSEFGGSLMQTVTVAAMGGLMAGVLPAWGSGERSFPVTPWGGLALGLIAAAAMAMAARVSEPLYPFWPDYDPAGSWVPWLTAFSDLLKGFLFFGVFGTFLFAVFNQWSSGWTRRKPWMIGIGLALGFAFAGLSAESLVSWLIGGLLAGPFLLAVYLLVFRHHLAAAVPGFAAITLLGSVSRIVHNAFPGAITLGILEMVAVAGGAWVLYRWLGGGSRPAGAGHAL